MADEQQKPNIEKQLRDAQDQRERLLEQLRESEAVIDSIETRLAEVTKSQEARLRADDRVDNALLDQVQNKKNTKTEGVAKPLKADSWYEIVVDEEGNKNERLRT